MGKERKEDEACKTGIYIIEREKLKPLNDLPGRGTINDIAESLGYPSGKFHLILTPESNKIDNMIFKRRTKIPLFVFVKDNNVKLSYKDVRATIEKIDWGFENRQLDFEDNNPHLLDQNKDNS
ncbi:MAG: hypothetical protein LBL58_04440 [Tannerellaceae bacterium]|nr:hypothetical protein [Tannerellaceae bacterium]